MQIIYTAENMPELVNGALVCRSGNANDLSIEG